MAERKVIDYLLEGGVKGKYFIGDKTIYRIDNFKVRGTSTLYLEKVFALVRFSNIQELLPIEISLDALLDDKEATSEEVERAKESKLDTKTK